MSNVSMDYDWYSTPTAKRILHDKYMHEGENCAEDIANRLQSIFVDKELGKDVKKMFLDGDFLLGGRSIYGAGSKGKFKASMSNCYILPKLGDNIEDIMEVGKEMARIFSMGGGCGVLFSGLRPNGARVHNSAKTSTGPCSYMSIFDSIGRNVGSNGRRAAMMFGLDCWHPDIEELLELKQNTDNIKAANISILFNDKFMEAVENNEMFELHFEVNASGDKEVISKMINAREFFMKFAKAQFSYAEPGALWIDRIKSLNYMTGYPESEYKLEICNP